MEKKILSMGGDGIGPEVCHQALQVLKKVSDDAALQIDVQDALVGGCAYEATGNPLPDETLHVAKSADAILMGAVGGPRWDNVADHALRPERGLLKLRSELTLYANLRPAQIFPVLIDSSSLKPEVLANCDIMVVRELTGGIYFGTPRGIEGATGQRRGFNTLVYTESEIARIVDTACQISMKRSKKLCSVDKANVLESSMLWREVAEEVVKNYPEISLNHLYVDNATMQLIGNPAQFDTIVTGNMFGDILSDAAAMITGSIGMLPSASLGVKGGLYEPVHGSAPDIAGHDKANPLAAILSVGMMFRYSFNMPQVEERISQAINLVLKTHRTADIASADTKTIGCIEMGEKVLQALETLPV